MVVRGAAGIAEQVAIIGDLSKLSEKQRMAYYGEVCKSLGLNPLTKPFQYLQLSGRLVLYATRDCTDQLRQLRKVSVSIIGRERMDDVYIVTARATTPDGRADESTGVVTIGNLNVVWLLPLWLATLHNFGAALLLCSVVMLKFMVTRPAGVQVRTGQPTNEARKGPAQAVHA
jgi:hypothetical protein